MWYFHEKDAIYFANNRRYPRKKCRSTETSCKLTLALKGTVYLSNPILTSVSNATTSYLGLSPSSSLPYRCRICSVSVPYPTRSI